MRKSIFWICALALLSYAGSAPADDLFGVVSSCSVGDSPISVCSSDFDEDGHIDLVTANYSDISIMLGSGDGTFTLHANYDPAAFPISVCCGDFSEDGHIDIAVLDLFLVSILLGQGDGTFTFSENYLLGDNPKTVNIGDFDNDGHLDLVVPNAHSDNFSILLGNGDGTFEEAVNHDTPYYPYDACVDDFNEDGFVDVAIVNIFAHIWIHHGIWDGTFVLGEDYDIGDPLEYSLRIDSSDFDEDGHIDLVVGLIESNSIFIL